MGLIFKLTLTCLLFIPSLLWADPINIHLKWFHKFQFAGYYAALEQGYFAEEGLDVNLIEGDPNNNQIHQLLNKQSHYAVLGSEVIHSLSLGSPLIIVTSIFQHAPEVLITRAEDNVQNLAELNGKQLMLSNESISGQINAMLFKAGVDTSSYIKHPYDGDINKLISKKVFAMNAYISNEPYQLMQLKQAFTVFSPLDYGIDFYGDSLVTTQSELSKHPQRVASIRRAVIRGWNYAIKHPDEMIQSILAYKTLNPSPYGYCIGTT
ncbi:diguanylate cyclase (GGDEF domain) [Marinomonas sp. MED121]|uniref:ABC transporter substrate-binding protein n=1 Tax=Marinomonas sp. MED121 TaxID=314277 RepID=UPI0000690AF9|nr:ABC transporter substrate-binding protein [Marinomonas sp. MED121]EAQ65948.1 diguanylate cyclase (GGDEF domain) [Marinomonas sp. MED121]